MNLEEIHEKVDVAVRLLGEHFDHVQILVTFNEEGMTKCSYRGSGNWYARQGMAHEFINMDVAQELSTQIANKTSPPSDGEEWKE